MSGPMSKYECPICCGLGWDEPVLNVQTYQIQYVTEHPMFGDTIVCTVHIGIPCIQADCGLEDVISIFRANFPEAQAVNSIMKEQVVQVLTRESR